MILILDITLRVLIIIAVAFGWCVREILRIKKRVKELEDNEHDYVPESNEQVEDKWRTKDDPLGLIIDK
jgi:hypothetical protein